MYVQRIVKRTAWSRKDGFTIIELLLVIIIISLLSTLAIVSYGGIQQRARSSIIRQDISSLEKAVKVYKIDNGTYPVTTNNPHANWKAADVKTDANCTNGSSGANWLPGYEGTLPQSDPNLTRAVDGAKGCYLYVSNGTEYIISAWNMLREPQTEDLYRRVGFREFQTDSSTQFYTCNTNGVGGVQGGSYDVNQDYYKHSYTVSNITDCDETPPSGA